MNHNSEFIPVITKAALALQNKQNEFKAIDFEQPKALYAVAQDTDKVGKKLKMLGENEFDMKEARHEVLNFAMNNQRIQKHRKMIVHQLIKLGAKFPNKDDKNYKELLNERKRLKEIREERKKFHQQGKNQTGVASMKCRSKTKLDKQSRKRPPVAGIDQHYGVAKQVK